MSGRYDDMLFLPHPDPKTHPRMSPQDRAAQFSPFAALTGHSAVLREAASYFKEDARKAGGEYVKREGRVKKIDLYGRVLVMEDGTKVPLDDLFRLDGALFTE